MKRYLLTTFVICFCLLASPASAVQEPIDREVVAKIRDEGLNRSQVLETFSYFTENIGPRLTASPA